MSQNKVLSEVINDLETLKEQIDKIKARLTTTNHDDDIKDVFDKLRKIAHDHLINAVIFSSDGETKYITAFAESNGYKCLLVLNNKAYYFYDYSIIKNVLKIRYFTQYDISEDITNILKKLPESNIDYAEPIFFKLYYILKKGYSIDFIKG